MYNSVLWSHFFKRKKKIIGPNCDSFSFCYISSFPPASSLWIYCHLHIPFIFPSVIFLFFRLLCLNMFKQHSKWGTAAFAADAGPEGESINCSITVLTFSSVLYLCSSWTIQYLPCYLFFLCHLKVKIGKLHSMSCDYTTNVSNCCCLLCLLQLNYTWSHVFIIPGENLQISARSLYVQMGVHKSRWGVYSSSCLMYWCEGLLQFLFLLLTTPSSSTVGVWADNTDHSVFHCVLVKLH